MKQTNKLFIIAGFLAITLAGTMTGGISTALAANEGVVNSVSYKPFLSGASLRVQVLDNSDENIALVQEFTKALRRNGYSVSDQGAMIMTIETREEIGGWSSTERSHVVELSTQQSSSNDDSTHVKLNLFDSNTGGILNQGENSGTIIITPSQYQINIVIENNDNGRRLWEGWASADIGNSSNVILQSSMIPAIIETLNKTVNHTTFKTP